MATRWRLDGHKCVVTGGSKGLGRACAEELLALGAQVLITARGEAELTSVGAALNKEHGGRLSCTAADVSTEEGRAKLVESVEREFGGALDILVNNVGTNDRKPAIDVQPSEYDSMVATNQTSAFFLCTLCLPLLRKSENPSVVNVSSLAGIRSSGNRYSNHMYSEENKLNGGYHCSYLCIHQNSFHV